MSTTSAKPDIFTVSLAPGIELILHGTAAARVRADLSTSKPDSEAAGDWKEAGETAGLVLPEDHPMWEHHTGGKAYSRKEWQRGDEVRAKALLMDLDARARVFFEILLDHPGYLVDADNLRRQAPATFGARRSLANCLKEFTAPCTRFNRRLPFYAWERRGAPTRYAVRPSVGRVFHAAKLLDIIPDR